MTCQPGRGAGQLVAQDDPPWSGGVASSYYVGEPLGFPQRPPGVHSALAAAPPAAAPARSAPGPEQQTPPLGLARPPLPDVSLVSDDPPWSGGVASSYYVGEPLGFPQRPPGVHSALAAAPPAAAPARSAPGPEQQTPPLGLARPPLPDVSLVSEGAIGSVAMQTDSDGNTACHRCGQQEVLHRCGHSRCVTPTCRPAWFQEMEARQWLVQRTLERMLDAPLFETLDRCEDCRPEGRCLRGDADAPRYCNFVFKRGSCRFGSKCTFCHLHGRGVTHQSCGCAEEGADRPEAAAADEALPSGGGPAVAARARSLSAPPTIPLCLSDWSACTRRRAGTRAAGWPEKASQRVAPWRTSRQSTRATAWAGEARSCAA
ncbi:unnamed protein product [Prorocentrum cordatum]|uniref:C3H1-type domain-containing protein n=1 Tax=Prorocentrum cordatum TaxID=2364126 RepID=A0ABN9U4Z8_9DINO|nr:unnamed protein product [Polarella glacialis]